MSVMAPFRCAQCGTPVAFEAKSGRTFRYRKDVELPIPADMLIETCPQCHEMYFSEGIAAELDRIGKRAEVKAKIDAMLAAKKAEKAARKLAPAPIYDEVYFQGLEWLNGL